MALVGALGWCLSLGSASGNSVIPDWLPFGNCGPLVRPNALPQGFFEPALQIRFSCFGWSTQWAIRITMPEVAGR